LTLCTLYATMLTMPTLETVGSQSRKSETISPRKTARAVRQAAKAMRTASLQNSRADKDLVEQVRRERVVEAWQEGYSASRRTYNAIDEATPLDDQPSHYFLGDGISIMTWRSRKYDQLRVFMYDYKQAAGSRRTIAVDTVLEKDTTLIGADEYFDRPTIRIRTSGLAPVAEALQNLTPTDMSLAEQSRTSYRDRSLATPALEGIDVDGIRNLIHALDQRQPVPGALT
jgi:hypothetical protein